MWQCEGVPPPLAPVGGVRAFGRLDTSAPIRAELKGLTGVFPQEFVMSLFLSTLGIWIAVNLAIVAALHFKPLRNRRRRLAGYGSLAYAKPRRRTL